MGFDMPLNNTKMPVKGRKEDGELILGEPEPLERVEVEVE